ncbi:MAG: hypothetical protein JWR26_2079 [Pedosphaera sp.]|nr:hypothetical protein [Pedosphaera sp.]
MSFRDPSVDSNLKRAASRWRRLRWLQHSATISGTGSVGFLLLGIGMVRGWINEGTLAIAIIVLLVSLVMLAWLIMVIQVWAAEVDRKWLAGALEGADRGLLDRLNTLVFLERTGRDGPGRWFLGRIAGQTKQALAKGKSRVVFSPIRPLIHVVISFALLVVTIWVYQKYSPWERLQAREAAMRSKAVAVAKVPELALPTNNVAEETKLWGEVRITDPARDMKVTKVDVVPLQIEAAANQALKRVGWFSTINGGEEKPHELPAPTEPRYAVYQPTLYLDEMRLADWDVLTYYANARTGHGEGYASDVYFLEVRPFREDILKLPGGEGGKAYQDLSEMTSLVERQQHVIRQTHQYEQAPQDQASLREQDRKKISGAEDDLGESVRHLYAKMASEMENKPIGEALDNLAKAEKSLGSASKAIQADTMKEGQNRERVALADLVAARKIFQKALNDNPKAFDDEAKDKEEPTPTAEDNKKLNEIAEFRNEAKAAQDFVKKAVEQQKELAKKAASTSSTNQPKLAVEEGQLQKSLENFEQQHPQVFKDVTNEVKRAEQSLGDAAKSFEKKSFAAPANTKTAADSLEKLQEAMGTHTADRQLADAYKLKEMLDQQIKKLGQMQESTNEIPNAELQQTARTSEETLKQLKQAAESKPTSDSFGPQLGEALSGTNKADMDAKLNQMAKAQGNDGKKQAAGRAKEGMEKVSQAFNNSQPSALQNAQKNDALKPGQGEAFEQGMQQLESMKQQMENGHALSAEQNAKQRKEALANLSEGLKEVHGDDQNAKQLLALLQEDLKDRAEPLNLAMLKKLMDQLRNYSIEVADKQDKKEHPDMTNVDPSKLPPAYRGRIEKYYQKLSEQKP